MSVAFATRTASLEDRKAAAADNSAVALAALVIQPSAWLAVRARAVILARSVLGVAANVILSPSLAASIATANRPRCKIVLRSADDTNILAS